MDLAIRVRSLRKVIKTDFYKPARTLVDGIAVDVESGVIAGFVGHNGAGKSTTIKTLIGATRPTAGTTEVLGGSPRDPKIRARLGYLPEFPRLPETVTPRELLESHAVLANSPHRPRAWASSLLERVDLLRVADARVSSFSKGMQQRLALALALVGEPELLILDEPMSGLDPAGRRLVREVLLEQREKGRTVFLSSHVLPDVEALCDTITIVHRGRTIASGPLDEVLNRAATGYEILFSVEGTPPTPPGAGAPRRQGDLWALSIDADGDPLEVASALKASGARIVSLESRRAHLEDELIRLIDAERAPAPAGGAA